MSDLPIVENLPQAESWFIMHEEGKVQCIDGDRQKVCETFIEARAFFEEEDSRRTEVTVDL